MTVKTADDVLSALLPGWRGLLQDWSASGQLTAAAQEALLLKNVPESLQQLVAQWASGNFLSLPPIELLSAQDISGAMGAYAISTGTIYLNRDWLLTARQEQVQAVLSEELGHHLDGLLNVVDTPGDEGEIFARIIATKIIDSYGSYDTSRYQDSGYIYSSRGELGAEFALPRYWLSYSGQSPDEWSGGISRFRNGDVATAFSLAQANGASSVIVQRINAEGSTVWSLDIGADYAPSAGSVLVDSNDTIYIVGGTKKGRSGESGQNDSDIYSAAISPSGSRLWYRNYGIGIHEIGYSGALDSSGNIILNGRVSEVNDRYSFIKDVSDFYGADFSGGWRGFQLKINPSNGSILQSYTTGSSNSGGELIAIDQQRNIAFVGGYTFGPVNGVNTIGDGDPAGANKYVIARNETTGTILWTQMHKWIRSNIVSQEAEDAIYFVDKGVLKRISGSTGQLIWSKSISNLDYRLSPVQGGGILVAESKSTGSLLIRHFDGNGMEGASQTITHQGDFYPTSLIDNGNGVLAIAGTTLGEFTVPTGAAVTVARGAGSDAVVMQVRSNFSEPLQRTTPIIRGNSLYTPVDGPSWTQAEANAVKLGGHLTAIGNVEEQDFIYQNYLLHAFIGLSDEKEEGVWEWSDGSPVTYTNWAGSGPDNAVGPGGITQDYVVMGWPLASIPGQWDDQWQLQVTEGLPGIAEIPFIRRGDSAYVIVQGPTWEEAEANAVKLGGHLVTINDAAENEWLFQNGLRGWIGFTDTSQEGEWIWSSGESVTYVNWLSGDPSNSFGVEHYANNVSGAWGDSDNEGFGNFGPGKRYGIAEIKLAPNNTPTGLPTLQGTFKPGSSITLNRSAVVDLDNFNGYTPTYNISWEVSSNSGVSWTRLMTADATDNNNSYKLTSADAGKRIRGVLSYLDGYGTIETVRSTGSIVSAALPPAPSLSLASDTGSSTTDRITKNGRINVSGLVAGAAWQYSTNGGRTWLNGTNNYFILNAGIYNTRQVRVRQSSNGITSPVNAEFARITVDSTLPNSLSLSLASDTGASGTDKVTRNGRIIIGGLEANATWQYSIDRGRSWLTGSKNVFTLAEGRYETGQIQLRQIDQAGWLSPRTTSTGPIVIDTLAPTIAITSIGGADRKISSLIGDNKVNGRSGANQTVNVLFGDTVLGTTQTDINGLYSYALSTANLEVIKQGTRKAIQAQAVDTAGNTKTTAPIPFAVETRSGMSTKDNLTGMLNRADTYRWNGLDDSLFIRYDSISNFESADKIEIVEEQYNANLTSSVGAIASFSLANVKTLLTTSAFQRNRAVAFTSGGMDGTFVALNDSRAGFQETSDALLFLPGYPLSVGNTIAIV